MEEQNPSYQYSSDNAYKFHSSLDSMGFDGKQKNWVEELLELCDKLWEERNGMMAQGASCVNDIDALSAEISEMRLNKVASEVKSKQQIEYWFEQSCLHSKEIESLKKQNQTKESTSDAMELKLHMMIFGLRQEIEELKNELNKKVDKEVQAKNRVNS